MITLRERTKEHVSIYFEKTRDEGIRRMLPGGAESLEEAVRRFEESQSRTAENGTGSSYGRTIYLNDQYLGDIWCYAITHEETPEAMLSFCIFEKAYWGQGICSEAVGKFLREAAERFSLRSIGAFVYAENIASIRVLEKNAFVRKEEFWEEGIQSYYYEKWVSGGGKG